MFGRCRRKMARDGSRLRVWSMCGWRSEREVAGRKLGPSISQSGCVLEEKSEGATLEGRLYKRKRVQEARLPFDYAQNGGILPVKIGPAAARARARLRRWCERLPR